MGMQKSVILMTNTTDNYDVLGDAFRSDSWYGYTDGIHTFSLSYDHFQGNFHMQGTLSVDPSDSDWFDIDINPDDEDLDYLEFFGESNIQGITFVGNYTFLRAWMERSTRDDLVPSVLDDTLSTPVQGFVDKVIMAM